MGMSKEQALVYNSQDISDTSTPTLIGFQKLELLNRNVKGVMPYFFAQRHDSFLEAFLTTNTMRFIDKDRQVLAKNKQNYVIEVWASIKPMQNNQQQLQFVGQLKLDKPFQAVVYVMTYNNLDIDNISS